jgi:DNA-binding transcriptional MerR regulator
VAAVSDRPDGLMTIGTFSRASLLSVKVLRAYHEAGILVPARVDPATGYRRYHAGQLGDAGVVRRLRSLDLPLDDVREVVRARDPELTRRVLAAHAAAMRWWRTSSPTRSWSPASSPCWRSRARCFVVASTTGACRTLPVRH